MIDEEVLILEQGVRETIVAEGARAYPAECCGLLIGKGWRVARAVPANNVAMADRRGDHYVVDPLAIVRAEKAARGEGLEIVGFYHSHPDHPAQASATDAALAWEGYLYVIISVLNHRAGEMRAWRREAELSTTMREVLLRAVG